MCIILYFVLADLVIICYKNPRFTYLLRLCLLTYYKSSEDERRYWYWYRYIPMTISSHKELMQWELAM